MSLQASCTRRGFLAGSAAVLASGKASSGQEDAGASVVKSQPLPTPKIILPTDALTEPRGPRKRLAAITTAYFKYSHADDIITKLIEGYAVVGRVHQPHCQVVSLHIAQFPPSDIGRGMAARYSIPLFDTIGAALTLGGRDLAVDGAVLVGEHGDYPFNTKEQHLYPRRRMFEEIVEVFRRSQRAVPVYNDKHFSYSWLDAQWMYRQSRTFGFPMMAGSSVPVAWRRPPLAFRPGIKLETALAVGFSGAEVYGFHTLELLQCFVEKRQGGEIGVRAVQCLEGSRAWEAAEAGRWKPELLAACLQRVPDARTRSGHLRALQQADPAATVFLVEYSDGFQAAAYVSHGLLNEFAFAAQVAGQSEPVSTWCELNKPQRDHFSFLCNHIEVMFRTGKPSYPVERTYLVTGILAALMDSRAEGGQRIPTPHLSELGYTPAPELTSA